MKKAVLLVDIAGVYKAQGFASWMEGRGIHCEAAQAEGIEGTHCYCDGEAEAALLQAIGAAVGKSVEVLGATAGEAGEVGEGVPGIRFLGSGDYHYLTCLLAQGITRPFSLVLMDNHPDNQEPALGNVLSCGGWVTELQRRCPALEEVLTIGPEGCPQDIPEGWLEQRSGKDVYLSLDKDIMGPQYAVTGWSQGRRSLEDVKRMLQRILTSGVNVVAVDICGETAPENCQAVNLEANKEILTTLIDN